MNPTYVARLGEARVEITDVYGVTTLKPPGQFLFTDVGGNVTAVQVFDTIKDGEEHEFMPGLTEREPARLVGAAMIVHRDVVTILTQHGQVWWVPER